MRIIVVPILLIALSTISYCQDSTVVDKKKIYTVPKLSVKFSPLHIIGEHPFNRYPSFNVGIEQRLKNESNTLYHEIGFTTNKAGISGEKILNYLADNSFESTWDDEVISVIGFRAREQFRSYLKRGERAFVFLGVEAYYNYQNTELTSWTWVNNNLGSYQKNYTYNRIKKVAGFNPIFGFSYFSKKEAYKNKFNEILNHIVMDLYVGLGVRFVSRKFNNVPDDVTFWPGSDSLSLIDVFDEEVEGNYFSPGITFGLKLGYIISK